MHLQGGVRGDLGLVEKALSTSHSPYPCPVYLGSPLWCARALFCPKGDGFVPQNRHVNLRIVGYMEPEGSCGRGDLGLVKKDLTLHSKVSGIENSVSGLGYLVSGMR